MSRSNALAKRQMDLVQKRNEIAIADRPIIGAEWVLADVSGSMNTPMPSGFTRLQALNQAIEQTDERVIWMGFDNAPHIRTDRCALSLGGSTNIGGALREVAKYQPSYVILMSDGQDVVHDDVLGNAERVSATAIIDTLYIGGANPVAEQLMRQIAEIGHGRFTHWDSTKAQQLSLTSVIQGLLPAPVDSDSSVIKL